MPYFISVVIVVGIMNQLLSPSGGIVNYLLESMGFDSVYFMTSPKWFRFLYVVSDIWQSSGWTAIIYLAAITSVSGDLYEAAEIDGAGRLQRIWHVTLPGILPTIIILFLLKVGHAMELGYEKVLLMYSPQTYEVADIFDTYVYRRGILSMDYSFATTVGLFKSVISFTLVVGANKIAHKAADIGLW
jgi:putative aldouronate transport system permease protein